MFPLGHIKRGGGKWWDEGGEEGSGGMREGKEGRWWDEGGEEGSGGMSEGKERRWW